MGDSEPVASTVLDRLLPTFQAAERHAATIAASADQVWAALTQVTTGELRLFRLLMGIRGLPGRLLGSPRARLDAEEPLLRWAVRFGFTILVSARTTGGSWWSAPSGSRGGLLAAAASQSLTATTSPRSTRPATPRWRPASGSTSSPAAGPSS
jgi:hypothetical protein